MNFENLAAFRAFGFRKMCRDELMIAIKNELEGLKARLEQLKQKPTKGTYDLADDFQEMIVELGDKIDIDLEKVKYSIITGADDDSCEDLKGFLETNWNESKNLFDESLDNLSDSFSGLFSDRTKENFLSKTQKVLDS
jgi:hypothetical protein